MQLTNDKPKHTPRKRSGLTYAELSTILAGLRLWQGAPAGEIEDTIFVDVTPLSRAAIDDLCERLNFGDVCKVTP